MKIIPEYILPMDKGTTSFTEYQFDEKFTNFLMEDPSKMQLIIGHIHSHHNMRSFFSGTDQDEVNENSEHHAVYTSLIVNNSMEMVARIAYRGQNEDANQQIKTVDQDGVPYVMTIKRKVEPILFYHKCKIVFPEETIQVPEAFQAQVKAVLDADRIYHENLKKAKKLQATSQKGGIGRHYVPQLQQPSLFDSFTEEGSPHGFFITAGEDEADDPIIEFTIYMLCVGDAEFASRYASVEDVILDMVTSMDVPPQTYVNNLIKNLHLYLDDCFPQASLDEKADVLYQAGAVLAAENDDAEVINMLLIALNTYVNELKK